MLRIFTLVLNKKTNEYCDSFVLVNAVKLMYLMSGHNYYVMTEIKIVVYPIFSSEVEEGGISHYFYQDSAQVDLRLPTSNG